MSAERLREAARVLRERSEAATPGPWEARHGGYSWIALYDDEEKIPAEESLPSFEPGGSATPGDATYIATMHPGVGLALADWLELVSAWIDEGLGLIPPDINIGDAWADVEEQAHNVADLILGGTR